MSATYPDHLMSAIVAIKPHTEAPAECDDWTEGGISTIFRSQYPVIIGWVDGDNWRYQCDPVSGVVVAVPVREGCLSSRYGDRAHFASAVFGWRRGKFILTPEGADFILNRRST